MNTRLPLFCVVKLDTHQGGDINTFSIHSEESFHIFVVVDAWSRTVIGLLALGKNMMAIIKCYPRVSKKTLIFLKYF